MAFPPDYDLFSELSAQDEWELYAMFSRVIFDTFVNMVVREQYQFQDPAHVSLQVEGERAVLFVTEAGRSHIREDRDLLGWARDFIAGEVLEVHPDQIALIYLDGAVGGDEPFLYVAGDVVMLSSGAPLRKGLHLL